MPDNDNTAKKTLQVVKIPPVRLHGAVGVRAMVQGAGHCEVVYMARPAPGTQIQKISKEEYIDLRTGEVKQFKLNDTKQRSNLTETFRNLTGLIRANFDAEAGSHRQLFITLTYAEMMTDHHRLMEDFADWYRRVKTHCKGHQLEYIAVAEPQERGAWHMHVMLKSDKLLFIDNRDMEKMWRQGFTDTQRLKSDDVGRYYVGYFTSLYEEISPDGEIQESTEERTKKQKKGARLSLYPVGMKFYRCSRGIVRPKPDDVAYEDIRKVWGWPSYREAYEVVDEISGKVVQMVQREHFKRGGKKDGEVACSADGEDGTDDSEY